MSYLMSFLEVTIKDKRRGGKARDKGPRVNEAIRAREVRLITENGDLLGVMSLEDAFLRKDEFGLDLVEVSPNAKPPVVKLIDYGKYKYTLQKKANEAKKKTTTAQLKEIQFRPNIEAHDLETKLKRAKKFLWQGDKVKMVMHFRGREMAYKDIGTEKFRGIVQQVEDMGATMESEFKLMGNRIITILAPDKKAIDKIRKQQGPGENEEAAKTEAPENTDGASR